jgi:hypothetical protein
MANDDDRNRALVALVLLVLCGCEGGASDARDPSALDDAGHTDAAAAGGPPTWHADIAPIVVSKCAGCHQDGSIAPFSLRSYEDAKPYALLMADAVMSGKMPPFLAQETDECQPRFPFYQDLRLSEDEKALIDRWARSGVLEGEAVGKAPTPPRVTALEREDALVTIPQPVEVDGDRDLHTCMLVDPQLIKDEYVVGRTIKPGNAKIVHHVVAYVLNPEVNSEGTPQTKAEIEAAVMERQGVGIGGRYDCFGGPGLEGMPFDMLTAWAPGATPNVAPPNSGQLISKDSLMLLDLHYHPLGTGAEVDDSTSLALMFADDKPALISFVALIGNFGELVETDFGDGDLVEQSGEDANEFLIPAGAEDHVEEMTWTWKLPPGQVMRIYAAGTHMHYVGRDMRIGLERAEATDGEPDEECLVQTPAWDFNWQRGYGYDTDYEHFPSMRDGDTLRMHCVYDNTRDNPALRSALDQQGRPEPVDVRLGEDTLDEMCLAGIGVIAPNVF